MKPGLTTLFRLLLVLFLLQLNINAANTSIIAISNDPGILILLDRSADVINTSSNVIINTDNTISVTLKTTFGAVGDLINYITQNAMSLFFFASLINYIIQNALSLFFVALLIMLSYWISRDEGMLIMPFEVVNSENKFNGKAISDLLIAELKRIEYISNTEYEGIENEKLDKFTQNITGEKTLIPPLGTVGIGSASISIGELLIAIKKLFRGSSYRQIINGSLDNCGSKLRLVACLMGNQSCTWVVQAQNDKKTQSDSIDDFDRAPQDDNKDGFISDIVRDLSFRIAYILSQKSISAKTLLGFKHYTEALDNYQQYILTKQINYLNGASENCIKATDVEQNYKKMLGLFFNLGIAYFNERIYDKADEMFSGAIELDPQNSMAWSNKGSALNNLKRYDESLKAAEKAIELNPRNSLAWYNKGFALDDQDKHDEAIQAYDKAIEINPQYAAAWNNKGIAFENQGEHDEAIQAYDKAIEINPQYAEAWNNKGTALDDQGKHGEAIQAYDKAIEINPRYAEAWNNKGNALKNQGKHEEAIQAYDKAIEINPRYANAWNNKGNALKNQDKHEEAIRAYDKAIELNPQLAEAWNNKGIALDDQDKHEEAIQAYDKAIELNPQLAEAWNNKGIALKALGLTTEADAAFTNARELGYTG
jgi:tetratricopeptide (TPR) repeat protein